MAIDVAAEEPNLAALKQTVSVHLRTAEAQVSLGVAIRHLIRPVAPVGRRIEGQTLRTVEHVAPTVHAVHELTAVLMITDLEVAVLMGTILGWKRRLCENLQ